MDPYYHNQANLPHFSGPHRLAMGIGRVALPLVRKNVITAAKKIGKELLLQAAPELKEVATKRKNPTQALKSTVRKQSKSK